VIARRSSSFVHLYFGLWPQMAGYGEPVLRMSKLLAAAATVSIIVLGGSPALAASSTPSPAPSPNPSGSSATDAAGKPVVTFGIGPSKNHQVDRRPNYNMLSPKGGLVSDEVAVVNLTYQPLTLNLYAADGLNADDGSLTLQPGYVKPKDAAAWVTFGGRGSKGYVKLAPREKVYVPFVVHIPKTAYVGDHLAGIVASLVSEGTTPGERGTNVKLEQRVGIRLGVRVAGVLTPGLEVKDLQAAYAGTVNPFGKGNVTVTYTVTNTGNVRLGGQQEVSVHGLIGPTSSAPKLANVPMLLPGNSAKVSVTVPEVTPVGYMTADVSVSGLAVAGDADPATEVASASTNFWAIAWTLLAGLLGLTAIAAAVLRRRRDATAPAASATPSPENLVSSASAPSSAPENL
jgi:hypothetical protein